MRRLHEESDVKRIWENSGMGEKDKSHLSRAAQRRIREKEERRGLILKAAMGLFASEGYNHASMERIAYQFIIWQDRSEDLQEVSRELVDFILGGIDALRI